MNLKLLDALERADIESRPDRAERIKWLGTLEQYSVAFLSSDIESPTRQSQDSSATHDLSAAISSSIASLGVFHPSV
ncbi:hypothetical protein BVV20_08365 [Xanthomonas oryzae pv. oryzae]|nr:hypothetical protein BVV20_08365 [Xanthomonas oryzae pv. oryzae]